MKYYIGKRLNPQLSEAYYIAYGKMSKKDAKAVENCLYGSCYLTPYNTVEEYNAEIERLKNLGKRVTTR